MCFINCLQDCIISFKGTIKCDIQCSKYGLCYILVVTYLDFGPFDTDILIKINGPYHRYWYGYQYCDLKPSDIQPFLETHPPKLEPYLPASSSSNLSGWCMYTNMIMYIFQQTCIKCIIWCVFLLYGYYCLQCTLLGSICVIFFSSFQMWLIYHPFLFLDCELL